MGMKDIRCRRLGSGWYPQDEESVRRLCSRWRRCPPSEANATAAIVPHAGWAYSGALAYLGLSSLDPDAETIAVVGGHLAAGQTLLLAEERGFETPLGPLEVDIGLRTRIAEQLETNADRSGDNSVEIHLPLLAYLFPRVRVLWLRAPADRTAIALGQLLADESEQRRIAVVGSTDLTHFGPRFGLTRQGTLQENQRWAQTVNDRGFLDCCLAADADALLAHATENQSACSPGAAAAAVAFSAAAGASVGRELGYDNSFRQTHDDSFVGYGTVALSP